MVKMVNRVLPLLVLLLALLAACGKAPPQPEPSGIEGQAATEPAEGDDFGAVSVDVPAPPRRKVDIRQTTDWPPAKLTSGEASVSCETDYATHGDGVPLSDLEFFSVLDAMTNCQVGGVVRLRYKGRMAGDFTTLVERVGNMSTRMGIDKRILDVHSTGGQVEDAIRAGDLIAESNWTMWVREDAVCHSACVLLLAGGDDRLISGDVGIHRIIRIASKAATRAELSRELRGVHGQMKDYLERNGASVAVADLMMTVPNRKLRLLTATELDEFGLTGTNAAQDDLERIKLVRRCGEAFVRRKDAFARAFDVQCATEDAEVATMNECGLGLRARYGFPDRKCPADSPMAERDRTAVAAVAPATPADKATRTQ